VLPLGHALDTDLQRCADKQAQVVGIVRQGVVRAPADDNAGPLVRDVPDGVESRQIHLLFQRVTHTAAGQGKHIGIHGDGVQEALGPLVEVFKNLLAQAALLGGLLQQLLVIEGNAQLLGHADADLLAAAAKLPADGDDGFHREPSSPCWFYYTARRGRRQTVPGGPSPESPSSGGRGCQGSRFPEKKRRAIASFTISTSAY
ncbi:30S ribosomal protein S4, partial [Dysosmobacter welbionis]